MLLHKEIRPDMHRAEHLHAACALTLTLDGSYEEEFESGRQVCSAWDVQFKPARIPHSTTTKERGGLLFIVALDPASLPVDVAALEREVRVDCGAVTVTALSLFASAFHDPRTGRDADTLLPALLESLGVAVGPERGRDTPEWADDVGRRIRAWPGAALSLSELARDFDLHPVHLARVFRRRFGCSVGDYVRRQRIDRAASILVETDDSLGSIALDLGYSDQAHFTRAFRRETSWSPGRFRRSVRSVHGSTGP